MMICVKKFVAVTNQSSNSDEDDKNNNKNQIVQKLFKRKLVVDGSKKFQPKVMLHDILTDDKRSTLSKNKCEEQIKCTICNQVFPFRYILSDHMKRFHEIVKNFDCKNCERKFFSIRELIDHEWKHSGKKPFNCKICNMSFIRRYNMTLHLEKIHGEQIFTCNICSVTFTHDDNLKNHQRIHLPDDQQFNCIICSKLFLRKAKRETHEATHSRDELKCEICSKSFRNCDKLRQHCTKYHSNEADQVTDVPMKKKKKKKKKPKLNFICSICNENILGEINYRYHFRSHLPEGEKYSCKIKNCTKSFLKLSALTKHELTHASLTIAPLTLYRCTICYKTYHSEKFLRKHEAIRHQTQKFSCDICGDNFPSTTALRFHRRIHLPEKEKFTCQICSTIFLNYSTLKKHRQTVHDPVKRFKCDICDSPYKSITSVIRHKKDHHGLVPLECDICGKKYSSKQSLQVHKNTLHENCSKSSEDNLKFPCKFCDKKFRKRHLKRHEKTHEINPLPKIFLCSTCDEIFASEKQYREHKEQHEITYPCSLCSKVFELKQTLEIHEKVHFMMSYECEICSKVFKYRESLMKHHLLHNNGILPINNDQSAIEKDLEDFLSETMQIEPLIIDPPVIQIDEEILEMEMWQLEKYLGEI